jgi:hypothetical protein
LLLKNAVLEAKLLLLSEGDCVVGLLAAACAHTVLPGRESAAFEGFGRSEKGDAETTADFIFGASIASHDMK